MKPNQKTTSLAGCSGRNVPVDISMGSASGFSLIEVLISIIILSFGLLGMVGLQAGALQANRDARLQSSAIALARELAEMMRGNKDVAIAASGSNPYLGSFDSTPLEAGTPTYCLSVGSTACADATAVANAEMTEWLARIDAELPGARVDTCFDTAPYDANGLPQWACTAGTSGVIVIKIGWTRGSTDRSSENATPLDRASRPSIIFPVTAGSAT